MLHIHSDLKIGAISNSSGEYLIKNILPVLIYRTSLIGYRSVARRIRINGVSEFGFDLTLMS